MTRLDEYNYLVERSRRFILTAEMQIEKGLYDLAAVSYTHLTLPTNREV